MSTREVVITFLAVVVVVVDVEDDGDGSCDVLFVVLLAFEDTAKMVIGFERFAVLIVVEVVADEFELIVFDRLVE